MMHYGTLPSNASCWLGSHFNPVFREYPVQQVVYTRHTSAGIRLLAESLEADQIVHINILHIQGPITEQQATELLEAFCEKAGPGSELQISDQYAIVPFIRAAFTLGLGEESENGAVEVIAHHAQDLGVFSDTPQLQSDHLPQHLRFYKTCPGVHAICVPPTLICQWYAKTHHLRVVSEIQNVEGSDSLFPSVDGVDPSFVASCFTAETPMHLILRGCSYWSLENVSTVLNALFRAAPESMLEIVRGDLDEISHHHLLTQFSDAARSIAPFTIFTADCSGASSDRRFIKPTPQQNDLSMDLGWRSCQPGLVEL